VKFIRQIVYTFEARSADSWRVGRVLLGGDACHTMPPYLGQGACSGMRDGINLGWRLDLVLRSVASPDLLDGYEAERKPHVTTLTHMAIGLGKIANEHDPVKAAARDEGMRTHKPAKPPFPYLQTGLLDPEGSPMTGRIWPQGRVRADGREGRFDDVVGGGFVLLSRAPADLAPETAARLDALGCKRVSFDQFEDLDGVYARFFDEQGIACILARPDFVTFGTRADASGAQELARAVLAGLDAPGGHA
jgi:3-(3-hydroxy-phenyl)propionate hydroxylase